MSVVATQLKKGQCIKYQGERGLVLGIEHRTPGKGNALIAATIRSFKTNKTKTIRFSSGEKVEIVETDRQKLEYSYKDQGGYYFMDINTYESTTLQEELVADILPLLKEGQEVEVLFLANEPVSVSLPPSVELIIKSSADGVKGNTANNPTKPAILETGLSIQVPLFVKEGEMIKVNTMDNSYMSRA